MNLTKKVKTCTMKNLIHQRKDIEDNTAKETAKRMIKIGKLSLDEIALCVPSIPLNELKKLEAEIM